MKKPISRLGLLPVLIAGLLVSIPVFAISAAGSAPKHPSPAAKAGTGNHTTAAQQSSGERKFNQNCSRCHRTPEGFSPSISGTILKHMRVRASLSEQDERDILLFLNP